MGVNEELIHKRQCPTCKGSGKIYSHIRKKIITCDDCGGSGEVIVNTEIPS